MQERPTRVRWLVFSLACGSSWILYLHRYTWNFIGPELEKAHGFSKTELGTLFSLFSPSYGFLQIPSGILSDLVGPHFFLGTIILLWSLALPSQAAAVGFYSLAGVRLLFGATQAGCYPNLAKVTQVWFPPIQAHYRPGVGGNFFRAGWRSPLADPFRINPDRVLWTFLAGGSDGVGCTWDRLWNCLSSSL